MPGSIVAATASTVLPLSLSRAFSHSREFPIRENEYQNGESQRRSIAATSRKSWQLSKLLTPTQFTTLRDFYETVGGPKGLFYFYDGTETTPKWGWDATGASTTGRYTVRFTNDRWSQLFDHPRHGFDIGLIEVA